MNDKSNGCLTVFLILIVIGIIGSFMSKNDKSPSVTSPVLSVTDVKEQIKEQVKIKKLKWSKGGFNNIMMVNLTFENKSNADVKDIELTCEHFSNSGTKIDSNTRVIYEIFKAGKSKRIHDFNMGLIHSQAETTNCRITNLVVQ